MSGKGYVFDSFYDDQEKSLQEKHLDRFQQFLSDWRAKTSRSALAWDVQKDPLKFQFTALSSERLDEMIQTEHETLKKIALVLGSITWELIELKGLGEKVFYPALSIFGEIEELREQVDGEHQLHFGKSLGLLMQLWNYIERINLLVKNAIHQLASLQAADAKPEFHTFQQVAFHEVFRAIADILAVLITLDQIISQNEVFIHYMAKFRRMMSKVRTSPEDFQTDEKTASQIQYLLQKIDGDILDNNIFNNCIQRSFEDDQQNIHVQTNVAFRERFFDCISSLYEDIGKVINTPTEHDCRSRIISLAGLFLLYSNIFLEISTSEQKVFKGLWDFHKKIPLIHMHGQTYWSLAEFLLKKAVEHVRFIGVKNPKKEMIQARQTALSSADSSLQNNVQNLSLTVAVWISKMESDLNIPRSGRSAILAASEYLNRGLNLAEGIQTLLRTTLILHVDSEKPMKSSQVLALFKLIGLLKSIQAAFHRSNSALASHISTMTEYYSFNAQKLLIPIRNRLEKKRNLSQMDIDQLSCVKLALLVLTGSPSPKRVLLGQLATSMSLFRVQQLFRDKEQATLRTILDSLDRIANFDTILKSACDCTFLYWHRVMTSNYFDHVFKNPSRASELKHIFSALEDCAPVLESAIHLRDEKIIDILNLENLKGQNKLRTAFEEEILEYFQSKIIQPLCTEIENELRMHVHMSKTQQTSTEPLNFKKNLADYKKFFMLRPIRFFGTLINLNYRVSHYLDTIFYNLTTLSQNDWKTYEEMRTLSREKYNLDLVNVYLPGQTLGQGLDVLEVTRNIHVFVGQYCYNLNQNMFIERWEGEAKSLNTIHIRHLANSIRTHGTGIMNTTVNFIFQFLTRKLYIFSKFLYDDHIKSRLIRDAKFFKENRHELGNKYPLSRAKQFVRDIRVLGTTDGKSYLDKFRDLITEIGNSLAYIRMVRAGGLRSIRDAVQYVPDLENIENFEEWAASNNLAPPVQCAGKNLYSVLKNLAEQFAEGSDYFKKLENVFKKEMLKDDNKHLKNFYTIIPPLTVSFVDSMIIGRDKMIRNGKGAKFTEDGFIVGIAFILKVLEQNSSFKSMHWFESVADQYRQEYEEVQTAMNEKKVGREEELNTMRLTLQRTKNYKKEFELLSFAFAGAKLFFMSDTAKEKETTEKSPNENI